MKTLLLLILICSSSIVRSQLKQCDKFINGKFKIVDQKVGNSIIERNDSTYIEYQKGTNMKIEYKIISMNNCTFILDLVKIHENPNNIIMHEEYQLTIEVIELKENSYIQKFTNSPYDEVWVSELIRIE